MTRLEFSKASGKSSRPRRELRPGRWPLQNAKSRFSELVRLVKSQGPQVVTLHGRDEVVVIAIGEFRRLKGARTGAALVAAMQSLPYRNVNLAPAGRRLPVRDVTL